MANQLFDDYNMGDFLMSTEEMNSNEPNAVDKLLESFSDRSTNQSHVCSSKESPEYMPNQHVGMSEHILYADHGSEVGGEECPKMKKTIKKRQFEPIVDNNVIYDYEKNPDEYKKARKRIQNRESATRVRSKVKVHMECVETEVERLRSDNAELKLKVSSLTAENTLLKQHLSFLERLTMRGGGQSEGYKEPPLHTTPPSNPDLIDWPGYRENSSQSQYKHIFFLGLFTAVIMVYGVFNFDEGPASANMGSAYKHNGGYALKSETTELQQEARSIYQDFGQIAKNLLRLSVVFFYCAYLLYVLAQRFPQLLSKLMKAKHKLC